jgi:hypothetical protein
VKAITGGELIWSYVSKKKLISNPGDTRCMLFVGLDIRKNYSEFAITDNDGRLIEHGRVENSFRGYEQILQ